jgi:hypothetical protein
VDAIFVFWIMVALTVGGVVLLHPLARHPGAALEERL